MASASGSSGRTGTGKVKEESSGIDDFLETQLGALQLNPVAKELFEAIVDKTLVVQLDRAKTDAENISTFDANVQRSVGDRTQELRDLVRVLNNELLKAHIFSGSPLVGEVPSEEQYTET